MSAKLENEITSTTGTGSFLPDSVQTKMESHFNSDFSNVRIHNDRKAVRMNQALGAHAFTHKNHIYFNRGMYNPSSRAGNRLLAHELTHVVQQNKDEIQPKLTIGQPGDRYEQEADSVARAVMQQEQGNSAQEQDKTGVRRHPEEEGLQTQPLEEEEESLQAQPQEEEEEEIQAKLQRQEEEEEEIQAKLQRQEEEEEEIQAKT